MNHALARLRKRAKLTQQELATKSGLSRSYIAALESGHRKAASVDALKRLSKALRCEITELI